METRTILDVDAEHPQYEAQFTPVPADVEEQKIHIVSELWHGWREGTVIMMRDPLSDRIIGIWTHVALPKKLNRRERLLNWIVGKFRKWEVWCSDN